MPMTTCKPANQINPVTGVRVIWTKLANGDVMGQNFDAQGVKFDQGVMSAADARHQAAQDRKHGFVAIRGGGK